MEVTRWNRRLALATLLAIALAHTTRAQAPDRDSQSAAAEIQEGISLTGSGRFQEAIPHFLTAREQAPHSFALEFNLALCYVGTRQFREAIQILSQISDERRAAEVKNLLAQAFIGDRQPEAARKAFDAASALAPQRESLYMLVSQASLDEGFADLGRHVLDAGLRNLPGSAKLHFQKGILDAQQDDIETAGHEFQKARTLAPGSEVAFIAAAEEALYAGRMPDVIASAREGIRRGYHHYLLLTMLGEALLRSGATPETPEFNEARTSLEKAVAARPGYASSHIALGRVYLALGHTADAVTELEAGRRLDPQNHAIYPPLAAAYRLSGESEKAKEALAKLAELNRADAARINAADGGGHVGYIGGTPKKE